MDTETARGERGCWRTADPRFATMSTFASPEVTE